MRMACKGRQQAHAHAFIGQWRRGWVGNYVYTIMGKKSRFNLPFVFLAFVLNGLYELLSFKKGHSRSIRHCKLWIIGNRHSDF